MLNRRNLLGASAAVTAAALPVAAAAAVNASEAEQFEEWERQSLALEERANRRGVSDEEVYALTEQAAPFNRLIMRTPATDRRSFAVKCRLGVRDAEADLDAGSVDLLSQIARYLEQH